MKKNVGFLITSNRGEAIVCFRNSIKYALRKKALSFNFHLKLMDKRIVEFHLKLVDSN